VSPSRNSPAPFAPNRSHSIDVTSGPRDATDPRNVRASQQAMASMVAGSGLRYSPEGRLEVDSKAVSLVEQVEGQTAEDLEQAARALDFAAGSPTTFYATGETFTTAASVAEQDYLRITLKPNLLVQNRGFHLKTLGRMLNDTGGNVGAILRVYLGATEIFRANTGAIIVSDVAFRIFELDIWFSADEDSQQQSMQGTVLVHAPSDAAIGVGSIAANPLINGRIARYKSTVDMTIQQDLAVTLELSASSASYYFQLEHATLFHF